MYQFNQTSSNNYSTALQLAASIAAGLMEVQSGKGFSPASGTFSTQVLNMGWTTSIQKITEKRTHEADKIAQAGTKKMIRITLNILQVKQNGKMEIVLEEF